MRVFSFLLILLTVNVSAFGQNWNSVGIGTDRRVKTLAVFDNEIYVGGEFTTAGGINSPHIAKWNGSTWSAVSSGTNGYYVFALCPYNGSLYLGGGFSSAGNIPAMDIAEWNGTSFQNLGNGTSALNSICQYYGDIYAAGFTSSVDKWDGSSWVSIGNLSVYHPPDLYGFTQSMTVYNNELFIAGYIESIGPVQVQNVAKWNGGWSAAGHLYEPLCLSIVNGDLYAGCSGEIRKWDGSDWSLIGHPDGNVYTICQYNGSLYAGGSFSFIDNVPCNNIAKWDGANWYPLGSGLDSAVFSLCEYDGSLYVGGIFITAGGDSANRIARWSEPTSVVEINKGMNINVTPNPVSEKLSIMCEKFPVAVDLYNSIGQIVYHTKVNTKRVEIATSEFPSGVYFVFVKDNSNNNVKRIVIEH